MDTNRKISSPAAALALGERLSQTVEGTLRSFAADDSTLSQKAFKEKKPDYAETMRKSVTQAMNSFWESSGYSPAQISFWPSDSLGGLTNTVGTERLRISQKEDGSQDDDDENVEVTSEGYSENKLRIGFQYFTENGLEDEVRVLHWPEKEKRFPKCKRMVSLLNKWEQCAFQERISGNSPKLLILWILIAAPVILLLLHHYGVVDANAIIDFLFNDFPDVSGLFRLPVFLLLGALRILAWIVLLIPGLIFIVLNALMTVNRTVGTVILGGILAVLLVILVKDTIQHFAGTWTRRREETAREIRKLMGDPGYTEEAAELMDSGVSPICWEYPWYVFLVRGDMKE